MQRAQDTSHSTAPRKSVPVTVSVDGVTLAGDLAIPQGAKGIVIFAHGSGSSRFSPRNRYVADVLHEHGVGTLLIDLLTAAEGQADEKTRALRFNIDLLARRLEQIGEWTLQRPEGRQMKLGYFGASTGGAAALIAAAAQPKKVFAVVSRGGRPDLATEILSEVRAPALFIVGENDPMVLDWNKQALEQMNSKSRLEIVPWATHLFEEPGTLEAAAQLAAAWFEKNFA